MFYKNFKNEIKYLVSVRLVQFSTRIVPYSLFCKLGLELKIVHF